MSATSLLHNSLIGNFVVNFSFNWEEQILFKKSRQEDDDTSYGVWPEIPTFQKVRLDKTCEFGYRQLMNVAPGMLATASIRSPYLPFWLANTMNEDELAANIFYVDDNRGYQISKYTNWHSKYCRYSETLASHSFAFYNVKLVLQNRLHRWIEAGERKDDTDKGKPWLFAYPNVRKHTCQMLRSFNFTQYLKDISLHIDSSDPESDTKPTWPEISGTLHEMPTAQQVFYGSQTDPACPSNCFKTKSCKPTCESSESQLSAADQQYIPKRPYGQNFTWLERSIVFVVDKKALIVRERFLMTKNEFLGRLGGIFGLFLGASIISFLQVFFNVLLLPLKLCWFRQLKESGEKSTVYALSTFAKPHEG